MRGIRTDLGRPGAVNQDSHARPTRSAEFRFYEELNDFLPAERRKVSFVHSFHGCPAVRDVIQAIGVPHTAIDLVLVEGQSVDFTHRLKGGERVAVYPVFERLDISPLVRLRPQPLRQTRFILDVHLGRLARYLRMLGFDSTYRDDWDDARIIELALAEQRIILTRDIGILKQKRVTHGYWLRSTQPESQLREVVQALDLGSQMQPFTRCLDCNGVIHAAARETVENLVDREIAERFDRFWQCESCHKVYWQGSHHARMLRAVRRAASSNGRPLGPAQL
jgi:uncharacterized protein with PIN domain